MEWDIFYGTKEKIYDPDLVDQDEWEEKIILWLDVNILTTIICKCITAM